MKRVLTSNIICSLLLYVGMADAAVPNRIPLQGLLTDDAGIAVNDDDAALVFGIFESEQSDTALWTETQVGITIDDGFFTVYLGDVTPIDPVVLVESEALWLEMAYGAKVIGRAPLGSVPFALEARRCDQIGDLEEEDIQPKIGEFSCLYGVQSIDGATGEVVCAANNDTSSVTECTGDEVLLADGSCRTLDAVHDTARTFELIGRNSWATDVEHTLFCVDIPAAGMFYAEVDISSHRYQSSENYAAFRKHQLYFSRNGAGELMYSIEESGLPTPVTASEDTLTYTQDGDTFTFTLNRDLTGSGQKGLIFVYRVTGMGELISNLSTTCD